MGMTLCFASDDDLTRSPSSVIGKLNITHLHLTPTLASRIDPKDVPSVRFLLTSGESLTAKVRRDWAEVGLHHGKGSMHNSKKWNARYEKLTITQDMKLLD